MSANDELLFGLSAIGSRRDERGTGDVRKAFSEIYLTERNAIYRYALSLSRQPAVAEEAAQEAFFRLYREMSAGKDIGNIFAWLKAVVHNVIMDEHRRRPADALPACFDPSDPAPGPELLALRESKRNRVRKVLANLRETERQCLLLRSKGCTFQEIADLLHISINMAAHYTNRAVKILQDRVRD